MAITRALMKRQMYNMGGPTLEAGAPDLRLTGDQRNRGSYTQRRRAQMAGGGIMGSNAGSMLVAPTADGSRPKYGLIDDAWNKFKDDIIPNEIKENPMLSAVAAGALANYVDLAPDILLGEGATTEDWIENLLNSDIIQGAKDAAGDIIPMLTQGEGQMPTLNTDNALLNAAMSYFMPGGTTGGISGLNMGLGQNYNLENLLGIFNRPQQGTIYSSPDDPNLTPLNYLDPYLKFTSLVSPGAKAIPGTPASVMKDIATDRVITTPEKQAVQAVPAQYRTDFKVNPVYPITAGLAAGEYARRQPRDELPMDQTSINIPQTAQAAIDDPNLRFKPVQAAQGGRIGAQEGGLMDLGGMEKDYRQEGGFVPIGGEEKADDVPARLSKNEFVFTADAVRSAGGGDIDQGAAVMENLMENLEAGGKVSEESQGLEGARNMFANAQELQKRII